MSVEDIVKAHIEKCAQIQQEGAKFSQKVSELHVRLLERNMKPELQIGGEMLAEHKTEDSAPEGIS